MARYTIFVLPESRITITNGRVLDGLTQGDGSHLLGEWITLGSGPLDPINVEDGGSDTNFDDNDNNQRLDGAQSIDSVSFADNTRIEAEYQFDLRAPDGTIYTVVAVNVVNSSPAYATVEALAFVDAIPPRGVPLEVVATREGPGSFGQPAIDQSDFVPCFCAGTRIATPAGAVEIDRLIPGDLVLTDRGPPAPLRWIGRRAVGAAELARNPRLRPVRIAAGALGCGLPQRDLLVSRQHRMLVHSPIAARMFGAPEVLVPAIKLTALPGIGIDESLSGVVYLHLLLDRHEVIRAEGALSESLFTGPGALAALGPEAREEILTLFPELASAGFRCSPARPIPPGRLQRRLVARHARSGRPLVLRKA